MKALDTMGAAPLKAACKILGHQWFPGTDSEFLCLGDTCLRCNEKRTVKPWGECLGGHPMADHYNDAGTAQAAGKCVGPH